MLGVLPEGAQQGEVDERRVQTARPVGSDREDPRDRASEPGRRRGRHGASPAAERGRHLGDRAAPQEPPHAPVQHDDDRGEPGLRVAGTRAGRSRSPDHRLHRIEHLGQGLVGQRPLERPRGHGAATSTMPAKHRTRSSSVGQVEAHRPQVGEQRRRIRRLEPDLAARCAAAARARRSGPGRPSPAARRRATGGPARDRRRRAGCPGWGRAARRRRDAPAGPPDRAARPADPSTRAQARQVLGQDAVPASQERGRQRRLAEPTGRGQQDRSPVDLDRRRVQRQVPSSREAQGRGDAPQPFLPSHRLGVGRDRDRRLPGRHAVGAHPVRSTRRSRRLPTWKSRAWNGWSERGSHSRTGPCPVGLTRSSRSGRPAAGTSPPPSRRYVNARSESDGVPVADPIAHRGTVVGRLSRGVASIVTDSM